MGEIDDFSLASADILWSVRTKNMNILDSIEVWRI